MNVFKRLYRYLTQADLEDELEEIVENHTKFVTSLSIRQLEYYKSMDTKHLSRELLRLEQRIYDLEKPTIPK